MKTYCNPYQCLSGGSWLRANFHTHAGTGPGTCGKNPIQTVVDLYREAGEDVLCISNHNLFTDARSFSDDRILMVDGSEYSADRHMLTIGARESFHELPHQEAIDRTAAAGGFSVINHPNWPEKAHTSVEFLKGLRGYLGLEVFNGVIFRLDTPASGIATDVWDALLEDGRLLYGFANDDFHIFADAMRAYNVIYCRERSQQGVIRAVREGAFCASSGLYPDFLQVEGSTLSVRVRFPVPNYVRTFTYRCIGKGGVLLGEQTGETGVFELGEEPFVRIEARGENGAMIYFQPVYREGALRGDF